MSHRAADHIAQTFTERANRRRVAAGLLAAALSAPAAAAAQEATPEAGVAPAWLFVQRFSSATLAPDPARPDAYVLTLAGLDSAILAFTDHPDRLVATVPTAAFAEMVAAQHADPLNATLVATPSTGEGEISAVVVLDGAEHDAATGSVTYRVVVLAEAEGPLLAEPIAASTQLQTFGVGHLFVDADAQDPRTNPSTDQQFTVKKQDAAEKAMAAPAYAAGAISAARSVHKLKRQHEKPTQRPKRD